MEESRGNFKEVLLMEPEFVSFDKIQEGLYMTGFYGLTEDNLKKNKIVYVMNCERTGYHMFGFRNLHFSVSQIFSI